jgi:hypothetical protein
MIASSSHALNFGGISLVKAYVDGKAADAQITFKTLLKQLG